MFKNKKEALKQARHAKQLLKVERKDAFIDRKLIKKENKLKKKILSHKKEIKKTSILNNNDDIKKQIKWVNKMNMIPKGERYIENSSKDIIIDVNNVTKSYTTKSLIFNALNNVSLKIKKGEFVVILGPSGSGKSTLLNVVSGLDRPTQGEVIINGENLSSLKEKELTRFRRKHIGFIFQSYNLLPTLNVYDNVEMGRVLQVDKSKRLNIKTILADIGMLDQINKRTYELSGGQQQRVSIARALVKSPDIIIGDEPTGSLDSYSKSEVFKLLQDINKKDKTTIIIVTHNSTVAKIANKVIKVKDGKIESIIENKNPSSALGLFK